MGELASVSSRLYFVAAGMSLQKHPGSSFCLQPETWSLSSGSHFQTHQTSLTAWPGFFWRCCREGTVPKRSIITLSLSFICWKCGCICSPGSHTPLLPLQRNGRTLFWVRDCIVLTYQHSAHISLYVLTHCFQWPLTLPGKRWTFLRRESAHVWELGREVRRSYGTCCVVFVVKWHIIHL